MMDLKNPVLLGPVQNQEHHMNGVVARRNNFNEPILGFIEQCSEEFAQLTGRRYGLIHEYKTEDADTVFVSLGCAPRISRPPVTISANNATPRPAPST